MCDNHAKYMTLDRPASNVIFSNKLFHFSYKSLNAPSEKIHVLVEFLQSFSDDGL